MAIIGKGFLAALGLLVVGSVTSASAATPGLVQSAASIDDVSAQHLVSDRGSWAKSKQFRSKAKNYRSKRFKQHVDRHDHVYGKKRIKNIKKSRKAFNRGYSRGFKKGYRDSRFKQRKRHSRYYGRQFRGGFSIGKGFGNRGGFSFRY